MADLASPHVLPNIHDDPLGPAAITVSRGGWLCLIAPVWCLPGPILPLTIRRIDPHHIAVTTQPFSQLHNNRELLETPNQLSVADGAHDEKR